MKNKKMTLWLVLIALMAVSAYAQYDDEKDFKVEREGNGITITRYIGTKTVVRIPPRIQNLPVTNIGSGAFAYCFSLASVTIPDSVTSIGEDAFFWCTSLTSVTIPNSVTNIGSGAFFWCTSLTSVTIPNSVTSIGDGAFSNCTSLIAINVNTGNSAYSAQDGILYNKDKTILHTYPAGKTNASFTIQNSVTSIGSMAFSGCISLTSVTIPNSVTTIGDRAFLGCENFTSVTIPNSVTSIGDGAFSNCTSLIAINVNTGNSAYSAQDGVLYNKNKTILHTYPAGKTGVSFTIPDSVTTIGGSVFTSCTSLTSVTIPDSVTNIGSGAFLQCTSLTGINIPNSVINIGFGAFFGCTSFVSITIPNSVTTIGGWAFFYCTSLTSVTIPDSVTSIGWSAFSHCTDLTSVTISNSVTSIGMSAFAYSGLTSVTFQGTIASSDFDSEAFLELGDLREKYLAGGIGRYTRPNGESETWTKR